MSERQSINKEALQYKPSKVSWATSEFLDSPPPIAARAFIYVVVVALGIGIAYSAWSSIAISIEARGRIQTLAPSVPVRSEVVMRVGVLHVQEGQEVKAGDVLVESEGSVDDEAFALLETQHELVSGLLDRMKQRRCAPCMEELSRSAPTLFTAESKGATADSLATARQLLLEFITQEESYRGMGAATRAQRQQIAAAERKLKSIRDRGAEDMLALQVENLNSEIARASSDIAGRRQSVELQIAQARNRLQLHLGAMMEVVKRERTQHEIVAPASGVVSQLAVTSTGELISPGVNLLEIVRLDEGLSASLYVENRDISQIEVGMKVRLKLDAFPEREYGTVDGVVQRIPEDVATTPDGRPQSTYEVIVALETPYIKKGNVEYPFRLGMTLQGVVVTKHESLLSIGLRKIFKLADSI